MEQCTYKPARLHIHFNERSCLRTVSSQSETWGQLCQHIILSDALEFSEIIPLLLSLHGSNRRLSHYVLRCGDGYAVIIRPAWASKDKTEDAYVEANVSLRPRGDANRDLFLSPNRFVLESLSEWLDENAYPKVATLDADIHLEAIGNNDQIFPHCRQKKRTKVMCIVEHPRFAKSVDFYEVEDFDLDGENGVLPASCIGEVADEKDINVEKTCVHESGDSLSKGEIEDVEMAEAKSVDADEQSNQVIESQPEIDSKEKKVESTSERSDSRKKESESESSEETKSLSGDDVDVKREEDEAEGASEEEHNKPDFNQTKVGTFKTRKRKSYGRSGRKMAESNGTKSENTDHFSAAIEPKIGEAPVDKESQRHDESEPIKAEMVAGEQSRQAKKKKTENAAIKSDESSGNKAAKSKGKDKSTEHPKRPPNAYILFSNDHRERIKEENPELKPAELARKIGEAYRGMSKIEKKNYEDKAKKDMEEFKEKYGSPVKKREKASEPTPPPVENIFKPEIQPAEDHLDDGAPDKVNHDNGDVSTEKPKRPPNAYILFSNDHREKIKEEHPELKPTELLRKIGEMYRAADESEKKKYENLAQKAKEEFKEKYGSPMKKREKAAEPTPPPVENISRPEIQPADDHLDDGEPHKVNHDNGDVSTEKPKRPPNAYILFSNDHREKIKEEHPELKPKELLRKVGEMYRAADESEKKKYENLAQKAKEEFKQKYGDTPVKKKKKKKKTAIDVTSPTKNHLSFESELGEKLLDDEGTHNHNVGEVDNAVEKPKRPPNAYILFANDHRKKIKEENPDLKPKELASKIGEAYRAIDESEKRKYEGKAKRAMEEFKEKYEDVASNNQQQTSTAISSPTKIHSSIESVPAEDLPDGWVSRKVTRANGKTKDTYWFSPKEGLQFRSKKQVMKFMEALKSSDGNENEAYRIYRGGNNKQKGKGSNGDKQLTAEV